MEESHANDIWVIQTEQRIQNLPSRRRPRYGGDVAQRQPAWLDDDDNTGWMVGTVVD